MQKKLTNDQKEQIQELIKRAIQQLGSQKAVANRCGVSDATINQLRQGVYTAKGDDMWLKVGAALGYTPDVWHLADTMNMRTVYQVLSDARDKSMFMAISNKAGSGKSAACKAYARQSDGNVFYIECGEWTKLQFLNKLCQALGVDPSPGYPYDMLLEKVLHFFSRRTGKPLLIIDQANSLKPSVLSFLIFLYNECEDKLAVVITGTEHLKKMIKKGVARSYRNYDEIDSRFGRKYIELTGATLADVRKICNANGVEDKKIQKDIYEECNPIVKRIEVGKGEEKKEKTIEVVEDMRRLKRAVQREQIRSEKQAS